MQVTVDPPANEDFDRLPTQPGRWVALMLAAAGVGVLVGLLGVAFRLSIGLLVGWRFDVLGFADAHLPLAWAWTLPVAFGAVGAGVGVWLSRRFAPEAAGSGLPRVEAVLQQHERPAGLNVVVVKFFGGALAIGSGLALGREGPTVQMGAIVGRLSSDRLKRLIGEPWTLMAAGAGAGLAVAFNAPLAAVIFVSEELLRRFSVRSISATLVATVCGTVVLRELLGSAPDFGVADLPETPLRVLPGFLLLGLAAGLLGVVFNATLLATMNLFARARSWPRGATGALVGAGAGLLAWFHPFGVGGGENLVQDALNTVNGQEVWSALLTLFAVRFVLTMISYGCGAPGGIFAPLLVLGALLGQGFAGLGPWVTGSDTPLAACVIVAMAAFFTAVVRSPLTGVVLLLEMTGSWTLILPMMAASIMAYAVPELLGSRPVYDALRDREQKSSPAA